MSNAMKGQYEVQKIIRTNIIQGLTAFGQTGWDCIEFAQAAKRNDDKMVTMNLVETDRIGWQHTHYIAGSQTMRKDEWLEEQRWQLQVIMKRCEAAVTASTATTIDIASMLITWLNGAGSEELRKKGVANLRVDPSSVIVYNDDSSIYQKRAVFTLKLQVPKEFSIRQDEVETVIPQVEPI